MKWKLTTRQRQEFHRSCAILCNVVYSEGKHLCDNKSDIKMDQSRILRFWSHAEQLYWHMLDTWKPSRSISMLDFISSFMDVDATHLHPSLERYRRSTTEQIRCGCVFLSLYEGQWYVLIVQANGGKWTLPKGKQLEDETFAYTARRECKEEIGVQVDTSFLDRFCSQLKVLEKVDDQIKSTILFIVTGLDIRQTFQVHTSEIAQVAWLLLSPRSHLNSQFAALLHTLWPYLIHLSGCLSPDVVQPYDSSLLTTDFELEHIFGRC
jgi:8-oxo-dGTP pyrophosphatase MutT (NUDIX family)